MHWFRFATDVDQDLAVPDDALDADQRRVLNLPDGQSTAVIGPPGSGKTTALLAVLAARVAAAGSPESVLVLTPNRAVATALRDRAARRVGVPTLGPLVRSIDSYAYLRVAEAAVAAGQPRPRLMTGAVQDEIVADLLAGHLESGSGPAWPDALGPAVRGLPAFRTELRELMLRVGQLGLTTDHLRALAGDARPEWRAAADLIDEYRLVLDRLDPDLRDSADILAEAVVTIHRDGPGPLRTVLVDDAQELTVGQLRLLAALHQRGVSVVAFGNPDLTAGAHRGARPDALGRLATVLGDAADSPRVGPAVLLRTVHRGAGQIGTFVTALAERVGTAGTVGHRAAPGDAAAGDSRVLQVLGDSSANEMAQVARILREQHLRGGVPWQRMAVVLRSQGQLAAWRQGLALAEVPVQRTGGGRALLDDPATRDLVRIVTVGLGMVALDGDLAADLLVGPYGGLDPVSLRRLRLALRREELAGGGTRPGGELLAEALGAPARLATLDFAPARLAARLATAFEVVRAVADTATAEEALWLAWDTLGQAKVWQQLAAEGGVLADEADERLDAVVALFAAAKRHAERRSDDPARVFFDELLGSSVAEDTLAPVARVPAVTLTTPSGVVATEFDVVVMAGLQDGVWPNPRVRGTLLHPDDLVQLAEGLPVAVLDGRKAAIEGELRMAVLAASRAARLLVLSAVDGEDERPSGLMLLAEQCGFDAADGGDARASVDVDAPLATRPVNAFPPVPLGLRAMVGTLRRMLHEAEDPGAHPAAAALAQLQAAGIAGASPDTWLGLRPVSTEAPVHDLSEGPFDVSPSSVRTYLDSPAHWFIDRVATTSSGLRAAVGTIVHAAAEQVQADPTLIDDPERLWSQVADRWSELRFDAPWLGELELRRARKKVDGLALYLQGAAASGTELAAAELHFEFVTGAARIRGTMDRVERSSQGITVVDLKTGDTVPTKVEAQEHAQLLAYQLALDEPEVQEAIGSAQRLGAKLVYLGVKGKQTPFEERVQDALTPERAAEWRELLDSVAQGMASGRYQAIAPHELGYNSPFARYSYALHFIPEVSA